jgi:hypothetical protein
MNKLYYLTKDFETPVHKFEKGDSFLPHIWASLLGLKSEKDFFDLLENEDIHANFKKWFDTKE